MLSQLQVINVPKIHTPPNDWEENTFTLSTCQRNLFLTMNPKWNKCQHDHLQPHIDHFEGEAAYRFLLETICGLQSQIKGEFEVTSQFKETFKKYLLGKNRDPKILKIVQKLFQDAKEVRTKHLIGMGQRNYSSIARKLISKKDISGPVLILGSGKMAQDLVYSLKKKFDVHLSARNTEFATKLCQDHNIEYIPWKNFALYNNYAAIVCAIGADYKVFTDENFFNSWSNKQNRDKIFIDFGDPSIIDCSMQGFYSLADILAVGALQCKEREEKINSVKNAINIILDKRKDYFKLKV